MSKKKKRKLKDSVEQPVENTTTDSGDEYDGEYDDLGLDDINPLILERWRNGWYEEHGWDADVGELEDKDSYTDYYEKKASGK